MATATSSLRPMVRRLPNELLSELVACIPMAWFFDEGPAEGQGCRLRRRCVHMQIQQRHDLVPLNVYIAVAYKRFRENEFETAFEQTTNAIRQQVGEYFAGPLLEEFMGTLSLSDHMNALKKKQSFDVACLYQNGQPPSDGLLTLQTLTSANFQQVAEKIKDALTEIHRAHPVFAQPLMNQIGDSILIIFNRLKSDRMAADAKLFPGQHSSFVLEASNVVTGEQQVGGSGGQAEGFGDNTKLEHDHPLFLEINRRATNEFRFCMVAGCSHRQNEQHEWERKYELLAHVKKEHPNHDFVGLGL